MSKFIELTYVQRQSGHEVSSHTLIQISTIAMINNLTDAHDGANVEVRIQGGGTVRCTQSYDAVKFLIGMTNE